MASCLSLNGISASVHTSRECPFKGIYAPLVGRLSLCFLLLLMLFSGLRRLLFGRFVRFSLLSSAYYAPAVAPAAAPVPASSSAIAPTAAPPAAPLTRPPIACLALSAAACCSAFFCSSVLAAGGGALGSIPVCCLPDAKHSFSSFSCWSALCWFFGYANRPMLLCGGSR